MSAHGDYPVPADKWLAQELADLRREIEQLKAARPMMATTLRGGTWGLVSDATGAVVLQFAQSTDKDGRAVYGVQAFDTISDDGDQSAVLAFYDNARGIVYPFEHHQWIVPTPQSISSGSFVAVAEAQCIWPNADTLQAPGAVICPVGSTAEVRLRESNAGDTTAVVTVPDGGNVTVEFQWLHPWSVGWGDATHPKNSPFLHWEVRLASGAGPITAFPPRHLTFRDHRFLPYAASNGGGRLA